MTLKHVHRDESWRSTSRAAALAPTWRTSTDPCCGFARFAQHLLPPRVCAPNRPPLATVRSTVRVRQPQRFVRLDRQRSSDLSRVSDRALRIESSYLQAKAHSSASASMLANGADATDARGFWPENSALAICAVLSLAVPEVRAARARPSFGGPVAGEHPGWGDGAKGDSIPRPKRLMELGCLDPRERVTDRARALADSHETEQWDNHQPIFSASSTMIPAGPRT